MLRGMEFSMVTTETQIYILIYWLIFIYESSEYQGVDHYKICLEFMRILLPQKAIFFIPTWGSKLSECKLLN